MAYIHPPSHFRLCLDLRTRYQMVSFQHPCPTTTSILSDFPNPFQAPIQPRISSSRHFCMEFSHGGPNLIENIREATGVREKDRPFPITAKEFGENLKTVFVLITDENVNTYAKGKLLHQVIKFGKHCNNEEKKLERVSTLGYATVKVGDPHAHGASAALAEYLDECMKLHLDDDIILFVLPDKTELNLRGLLEYFGILEKDMSPETMGVRAVKALWMNFPLFKSLFEPYGKTILKKLFLKANNVVDGKWYAELINRVTGDVEDTGTQTIDLRLTIKGADENEWRILARWFNLHIVKRVCVNWLVQLPRTYNELRKDYLLGLNGVRTFGIYLRNLFKPLFENLISNCTEPNEIVLRNFMEMLCGFDSVDHEKDEGPDADFEMDPDKWDKDENPHYNLFNYYYYSNIGQLNYLARITSRRVYNYRPHSGENDCKYNLASCFLLANSINHGTFLFKHPGLNFAYYLAQIPLAMALTSNGYLSCELEKSPFPIYLKQGMRVSLSTDDRMTFSRFTNAITEEYVLAQKTFKLSEWDLSESCRNSILASGLDIDTKISFIGPEGSELTQDIDFLNDQAKTNVPQVRMEFRRITLENNLKALNT